MRRLRIVHVLREGALLSLREWRGSGRGGRAMRVRATAGMRGRTLGAAALPLAVLAAARVRRCGGGAVCAVPPCRLPLRGRAAAPLQYYLVRTDRRAPALYKYLLASGSFGRRGGGLSARVVCVARGRPRTKAPRQ